MADFGYCFDCKELNYAITDSNGVFERNNMSNNHLGHNCHVFGKPDDYCTPIRIVLIKLNMGAEITHNEMILFKLAIDLGELDKYNNMADIAKEEKQLSLI